MIELFLPNFTVFNQQRSQLGVAASAGVAELALLNNDGFSADDFIVVENVGFETAELLQVDNVTGDTALGSTSSLRFAHQKDAYVYYLPFNQIKLQRATTRTGTYSDIATIDMLVDHFNTPYEDPGGTVTSWYKWEYFNSQNLNESALSKASQEGGHYCTTEDVRVQSGFTRCELIPDQHIRDYRDQAESEVDGKLSRVYTLPLSEVPLVITNATKLLAAGYLLFQEYGPEISEDISKMGQSYIREAHRILNALIKGAMTLVDSSGAEMARASSSMSAYSNVYTSDTQDKGEMFNLGDEKGVWRMSDPDDPLSSS